MSNHKNKVEDKHNYGVCVIDIGSPRLGNIGWSLIDGHTEKEWSGDQLDQLFPLIPEILDRQGLLLCLLYTSPSPRDRTRSRMPSSA